MTLRTFDEGPNGFSLKFSATGSANGRGLKRSLSYAVKVEATALPPNNDKAPKALPLFNHDLLSIIR